MRSIVAACLFVVAVTATPLHAQSRDADARTVTRLADRYVQAVRHRFPFSYTASGLPSPVRDRLDINSPADLVQWRAFVEELDRKAAAIDPRAIADRPEAISLALLRQAIAQQRAKATCRAELWNVDSGGWL